MYEMYNYNNNNNNTIMKNASLITYGCADVGFLIDSITHHIYMVNVLVLVFWNATKLDRVDEDDEFLYFYIRNYTLTCQKSPDTYVDH